MNKIQSLSLVFATCLVAAGCSNQELPVQICEDSETETVCILANLSGAQGSRAVIDGDGAAASADQCRLQVYMHQTGGEQLIVYDKTKTVADLKAMFDDVTLIKSQTYDFLFWADNAAGAYYNTDSLKNVTLNGNYTGNDDARDAFFAALKDVKVTGPLNRTVALVRPFAQLNVIATDVPAIQQQLPGGVLLSSVVPSSVKVKFKAPSTFNVATGIAGDSLDFVSEAAVYTTTWKTQNGEMNTLSMDYIFASTEKSVNTIGFTEINAGLDDIDATFTNIPLQRNYRTNIYGSLISNTAQFTVEIKPAWTDPDYDEYR